MALGTDDLEKIAAIVATSFSNISATGDKFNKVLEHAHRMGKKYNDLTADEVKLIQAKIKADEEYNDKIKSAGDKFDAAGKKLAGTLADAVKGLGSMVNSVYASDQSFTALSPVVSMIGNVAKGVTEAMGKMLSGVSILGNSTGRISEGVAQLVGVGIDLVTSAVQQQLENSQKIVNSYQNISKTGVTFGGNLERMASSAAKGGMSIDTYSKFITKNVESLNALGGSVGQGAELVTKFGKGIIGSDKKLLAMYGSYDEVNGAIADYMAMQARYGVNTVKTDKDLQAGAKEYLYNMKELSDLTGKSADALKKEEEERAKSAAYQLAMQTKSVDEQANLQRAFAMAGMQGGKDAQDYLQELIATNGHVASEAGLKFASQFPELAKTMVGYTSMAKEDQASFRKDSAKYAQDRQTVHEQEIKDKKALFVLNAQGVKDQSGILEMSNRVAAAQLSHTTTLENATDIQKKADEERNKKIDKSTEVYADSINSLEKFKQQVDAMTMSHMKDMGPMMDMLYGVAKKSAEGLDHLDKAVDKMISAFDKAYDALEGKTDSATGNETPEARRKRITEQRDRAEASAGEQGAGWFGRKWARITAPTSKIEAPTAGEASAGSAQAQAAGLKVRPTGDVTGGGESQEKTIKAAQLIQDAFGKDFGNFTSFKDAYHKGFPGSDHNQGLAFDFTTAVPPKDAASAGIIKQKIKDILAKADMPARYVGDEYFADKVAGTTGGHFHVSLPKMAKGGITNGLSIAGEAGPEAVIPLPDGRSVPVKMDLAELLDKFDQMLDVLRDHKDVSEKHMRAAI
jgi:hypothetical protein